MQGGRELLRRCRFEANAFNREQLGGGGVMLSGGPMDGWYVTPDAPVLEPDWPEPGGRYELTASKQGVAQAKWVSA